MLLSELLRFQDRQFLKDPIKAKMKKRCEALVIIVDSIIVLIGMCVGCVKC